MGERAQVAISKAVIPAAGRGTRFLPLTKAVPKELAPLVSTPAVELVVAEAAASGITDVLLVLGPGKDAVADYFVTDPDLEAALEGKGATEMLAEVRRAATLARIHRVRQDSPRGLGDAVAHAERFAGGEAFAVLLPDDLVDERDDVLTAMIEVQARRGGIVVGLVDVPRADIGVYGCAAPAPGADISADVVALSDLIEKPEPDRAPSTLAISGRYVLPPEIFDALRATAPGHGGEIQITDAMRRLALEGVPLHGVVFRGRRYDTGNRLEYVKAVVQFAERHREIGEAFTTWLREHVAAAAAAAADNAADAVAFVESVAGGRAGDGDG